jgi:hypothetical protein
VTPAYGQARTSGQAVATASQSLALNGGTVTVTSQAVDLAQARDATLRLWIRRGSDAFSEHPDVGEDFYAECLSQSGRWTRLTTLRGDGSPGEIIQPSFTLPGGALHAGFRLRLGMTGRDDPTWDDWHVDSICLASSSSDAPVAEWRFEESRWTGSSGELRDQSGNELHGTAYGDAVPAVRTPAIAGDPGTCGYAGFDGRGDGITVPGSSTPATR